MKKSTSLNKKDQSKLRTLSKIIVLFASLGKICLYLGIIFFLFFMSIIPTVINHTKITKNSITFIYKEDSFKLIEEDSKLVIYVNGEKKETSNSNINFNEFTKELNKYSSRQLICYSEILLFIYVAYLYLMVLVLKHLKKLFKNIANGNTPFTLDNVNHMSKMGIYMISALLLPLLAKLIFKIFTDINIKTNFGIINLVQILFVFAMSFVFRYGYNIQQDSKSNIYDDNE